MSDTSNISCIRFILELFRVCFVSVEFLVALLIIALGVLEPSFTVFVGEHLRAQEEIMKNLPVILTLLCADSIRLAWKLTTPKSDSNRELFDWPDYWKLSLRRNVTIVLCVLCAGVSIILWIFGKQLSDFWLGSVATWAIASSLTTWIFALFAAFKLREIMED
ncbi:MAG: hypothetical protein P8I61_04730 [Opitutae bacterium]|nr:hypothetical protein [Opitutae bacterium]